MMLLDTNLLVYASDEGSEFSKWSRQTIADAVANKGAAISAVSLAEVCVGEAQPETAADRIRGWGIDILDVPSASAEICAAAYRKYRAQRQRQSGKDSPIMPLPDFFIGAHAQIMGWDLATVDTGRFKTYFPSVTLKTP